MRRLLSAVPLVALMSVAGACAAAQAKAPIERPALDVPPPPPRVVEPAPVPDALPEPVPELPPAPAPPRPRPTPPRNTAPPEPKPEAKQDQPPTDATVAASPPPSVPQLRTPQTADGTEAERNVRTTLDRAKSLLGSVNFGPLPDERKKAYNDAKGFIQQAEEAIKQGNFVFAKGVADKAEVLAHELSGR